MLNKKALCLFVFSAMCLGCGGGGGGDSTPFYGGIWNFTGVKVLDDCQTSTQSSFGTQLTVNQDENRVVVNSGQLTLVGEVNENDGFLVTGDGPAPAGCIGRVGYDFREASDGEADAIFAVTLRCGPNTCSLAYGGIAKRQGGKFNPSNHDETELNALMGKLETQVQANGVAARNDGGIEDLLKRIRTK